MKEPTCGLSHVHHDWGEFVRCIQSQDLGNESVDRLKE